MIRKTPQQKKALEYEKDRHTGSLHGYVKNYPRTKARMSRKYRHDANVILKSVSIESSVNALGVVDEQALTGERLQHSVRRPRGAHFKAQRHTLKEWVTRRLEGRVRLAGHKYFARAYNAGLHRKSFKRFLQAQLAGHSMGAARLAKLYKEILQPSNPDAWQYHHRERLWLRSFFQDEPELEMKLNAWIRKLEREFPLR